MKRLWPPWPVLFGPVSWRRPLLGACLLLWIGTSVQAQDTPDDSPAPSADSQAVDEEEAEFRRRMEIEEGNRSDRTPQPNVPPVVDVEPVEGPADQLPQSSREHLDAKMTDLIIENGRWEPSDAARDAPFEPSEAARSDPQLAAEEAEAWENMVAAYHERESAAWSGGNDAGMGPGTGAGTGAGMGSGTGSGSSGGAGSASASGQAGSAGSGTPPAAGAGAAAERAPAGDPFSALEFLGGDPGAQPENPGAAAATTSSANSTDADPSTGPAGASSDPSSETAEGIDPTALDVLFSGAAGSGEGPAEEAPSGADPARESRTSDAESGADPAQGPRSAEAESEADPGQGSLSADAESEADPEQEPRSPDADLPDPAASEAPPEPSFWDWLMGLFDSSSEAEPGSG